MVFTASLVSQKSLEVEDAVKVAHDHANTKAMSHKVGMSLITPPVPSNGDSSDARFVMILS
jgi:hypothetical protein